MTIAEQVKHDVESLPPDQQRKVLDYVSLLKFKSSVPRARMCGILEGVDVTAEQIDESRREMWKPYTSENR